MRYTDADYVRIIYAGTYKVDDRNCETCPAHSHSEVSAGEGPKSVFDCKCVAGRYMRGNQSTGRFECVLCPKNSYSVAGSGSIEDCECLEGSYRKGPGDCEACPAFSWAPALSTRLEDCKCNAGFYLGNGALYSCEKCPASSYSGRGSESIFDCVCKAGFFGTNGGENKRSLLSDSAMPFAGY